MAWIGVDLDGTLAQYSGWVSETHIGEPVAVMVDRVRVWLSQGREVRIFTARVSHGTPAQIEAITTAIQAWCFKHVGAVLPVTCTKDYAMVELWDDRCVQVIANTGLRVGDADPQPHRPRGLRK